MSGLYFDKHRSLATGVATSGSGLGNTVMPIFIAYLIEEYSWKGSLLIMAGLCLNMFVCAALLFPLPPKILTPKKEVELEHVSQTQAKESEPCLATADVQVKQNCLELCNKSIGAEETPKRHKCLENYDIQPSEESKTIPDMKVPVQQNCVVKPKETLLEKTESTKEIRKNSLENNIELFEVSDSLIPQVLDELGTTKENKTQQHLGETNREFEESKHLIHCESETKESRLVMSDSHLTKSIPEKRKMSNKPHDKPVHLLHIFYDFKFDVFFLNNLLWNITSLMTLSFAPEFLLTRDISKIDAAFMVTVAGFGTFLGCILGGVVGNIICVNRLVFYSVGCLLMGMPLIILPFVASSLYVYTTLMLLFGIFFGIVLGLLVIITSDLLGPEHIGDGLGFVMFANGIGCFTGPVLAGLFIDYNV